MGGNSADTPDSSSGGDLNGLSSRGFSKIQVTLNYFLIASDRRGLSLGARSGDRKRPVLQVKAEALAGRTWWTRREREERWELQG